MCKRLTDHFKYSEISWKVLASGSKDGRYWARVTAYVTPSAIQNRLDELFEFDGWQTKYIMQEKVVNCRLSIWSDKRKEWITKENTCDIDSKEPTGNVPYNPYKTACSGAFKRAALEFGIGRYLKAVQIFTTCCEQPPKEERALYLQCKDKSSGKIFYAAIPTENDLKKYLQTDDEVGNDTYEIPKKVDEQKKKTNGHSKNIVELLNKANREQTISKDIAIQIVKYIKNTFSNPNAVIMAIRRQFDIEDFSELTLSQHKLLVDYKFDIKKLKEALNESKLQAV